MSAQRRQVEVLAPGRPTPLLRWLRGSSRSGRAAPAYAGVAGTIAATIALGVWGFRSLPAPYRPDLLLSFYRAIRLYTLDLGPATGTGGAPAPNAQLWVALVLAAALVLRGLFVLARNSLRRTAMRHALRGHVIVCGAGVHGTVLASVLAAEHDVVLVDIDATAAGMREPYGRFEWRLVGDAVRETVLVGAGVTRAHRLVAVTGNDYVNSQIVSVVRGLAGRGAVRSGIEVLVQAEDPSLARFMEEEEDLAGQPTVAAQGGPAGQPAAAADRGRAAQPAVAADHGRAPSFVSLNPFSANAIAAETLLDRSLVKLAGAEATGRLLDARTGHAPNLLLAGDHPLIDALVLAALRRWRVRRLAEAEAGAEHGSPPLHVSVAGPRAVERVARLRALRAPEPEVLRLEALELDLESDLPPSAELWLRREDRADHAIVACVAELDGIGLTVDLSRILGGDALMTRVTTGTESVFDRHLEERTERDGDLATTKVRSIARLACDPSRMSVLAGPRRLAEALSEGAALAAPAAGAAAEEVFANAAALGLRSDSAWRIRPAERAMLSAALRTAPARGRQDTKAVPLSALVRAGLRIELPRSPDALRAIAEELSAQGSPEAFAAWCEYARSVSDPAALPPPPRDTWPRPGDARAPAALLALRRAVLGDDGGLAELDADASILRGAERVAIFAGAAASMSHTETLELAELLDPALYRFDGAILSGGTGAGMPGVIGRVARERRLWIAGYVPEGRAERDLYPLVRETTGSAEFSILEPLAMWADVLAAGITAEQVRLVGCPGGRITLDEIALARALGARVAWVDPARAGSGAVDDLLAFGAVSGPGVLELPADPMTVRAFIAPTRLELELRVPVARQLHQAYRHDHGARKAPGDPALASWDELLPSLRESNLAQADDIPNKLAMIGKAIVRGGAPLELSDRDVELLAEIEHGRWNVERLAAGWQRGEREVTRNLTPYLTPWSELDEDTREWDREAVRRIAPALAELGWGVRDA